MTHDQKQATKQMMALERQIHALQDVAIGLKAIHYDVLTESQREMVHACITFSYADKLQLTRVPETSRFIVTAQCGDGLYWDTEKCLALAMEKKS